MPSADESVLVLSRAGMLAPLTGPASRTLPQLLAGSEPHEQAAVDRAVALGERS
jgi:hypothetical protein